MGIYDPVLQAYQHGVDQRIQLASQPMTLAQSILGGYQQGFGNRMQQEHLALSREQLAEQQRRAQAQEAEARLWHQGQMQDRLSRVLQGTEITDNDQLAAWRGRLEGAGLPGEMLPKQLQQDPDNKFDQQQYDADSSPFALAGPGGSAPEVPEGERPADKLMPWRGSTLGQKYAETERKAGHNRAMEAINQRKNELAGQLAAGRIKNWEYMQRIAKIDSITRQMNADSSASRAKSYDFYVHNLPSTLSVSSGNYRQNPEYLKAFNNAMGMLKTNLSAMGMTPEEMDEVATKLTDRKFDRSRSEIVPQPDAEPQPAPAPKPQPRPKPSSGINEADERKKAAAAIKANPAKEAAIKAKFKERTGKDY